MDMKGHTGGNFSLGKGCICGKSTKKKLNTKSSTETEIVSVEDCISQVIWTDHFMEAQGCDSRGTVICQDNKSAMLLERKGKFSSSERTKHIEARCYFIAGKIQKGEVDVVHCPAEKMIADFFTKPLQGQLFFKFRKEIVGEK